MPTGSVFCLALAAGCLLGGLLDQVSGNAWWISALLAAAFATAWAWRSRTPPDEAANASARRDERIFRDLFEALPEGFALLERVVSPKGAVDYRFLVANQAYERMTGFTGPDLPGRSLREVRPERAQGWIEMMETVSTSGIPRSEEIESFLTGLHLEVLAYAPAQDRMGLVVRDITARHKAQEDHMALEERLRQSEKMDAIGQLAGGVAHDFNNMLAGIMGYGDLLRRRLEDATLRRQAESIVAAARRAADLTAKLLAFSRKGKVQTTAVDVHQIVEEVCSLLEHTIDKRIRLVHGPRVRDARVEGDPSQLQNAILNLAINARDAMPEGGTIEFSTSLARLDVEACRELQGKASPGLHLGVHVRDSGTGMSEEVRRRMFEPFFTTKPPGKGTGMGLAAVWGTVLQHQGAIEVRSELGIGTEFVLWFPHPDRLPVEEDDLEPEVEPLRGRRLLVVDDEDVVRQVLVHALEDLGYEVEAVSGSEEACERLAVSGDVDLVLLDLVMPGPGGAETFRRLRSRRPDQRILIVSGYSLAGEAQSLLEQGAVGFLQKPWDAQTLSAHVARAIVRGGRGSSHWGPSSNPPPSG